MEYEYWFTEDDDRKNKILDAIYKNGGYCPCRVEHTEDTVCMCKDFREQKEPGMCHCGLFHKKAKDSVTYPTKQEIEDADIQ